MSNQSILGIEGGGGSLGGDLVQPTEHVLIRRPLQRVLGFGSYETAWAWMHKLRRGKLFVEDVWK